LIFPASSKHLGHQKPDGDSQRGVANSGESSFYSFDTSVETSLINLLSSEEKIPLEDVKNVRNKNRARPRSLISPASSKHQKPDGEHKFKTFTRALSTKKKRSQSSTSSTPKTVELPPTPEDAKSYLAVAEAAANRLNEVQEAMKNETNVKNEIPSKLSKIQERVVALIKNLNSGMLSAEEKQLIDALEDYVRESSYDKITVFDSAESKSADDPRRVWA